MVVVKQQLVSQLFAATESVGAGNTTAADSGVATRMLNGIALSHFQPITTAERIRATCVEIESVRSGICHCKCQPNRFASRELPLGQRELPFNLAMGHGRKHQT